MYFNAERLGNCELNKVVTILISWLSRISHTHLLALEKRKIETCFDALSIRLFSEEHTNTLFKAYPRCWDSPFEFHAVHKIRLSAHLTSALQSGDRS